MAKENPIDKEQVTDIPNVLPYPHHRGSALIKPEDQGKVKGKALKAMYQQTDKQLDQIKEQIELLARQANDIKHRVEISEKVYQAEIRFEPVMGVDYYLYEKEDQRWVISMISPAEWQKGCPYQFIAKIQLLADHTWQVEKSAT